ncbi:MAG TPA: hypothetical protein VLI54_03965 [Bacillota bacterium]|nr:hypothetical protein [Bacillota bacterium]
MQKNEHAGFEPALLPEGLKTVIDLINTTAQRLPGDEQERIFDVIKEVYGPWCAARDAGVSQLESHPLYSEAQASDYNRLVWSYLPLVVSSAYELLRTDGPTSLDDLLQAGVEGLYRAVGPHSIKVERLAFAPYATQFIKKYMRRQRMGDHLGTAIEGAVQNALYAYLAAERNAGDGVKVDVEAVRTSAGVSSEAMFGALALVATLRSDDNSLPLGYDALQPEVAAAEPASLSLAMQRAVAMLAPKQQQYIEQHFGLLPGLPPLSAAEIAAAEQVGVGSVRTSLHNAYHDLRIILDSFRDFGANFAAWPDKRFLKNYNVLTYLYRVGGEIPLDRTVDELRLLALQDFAGREGWARNKQIVAALYGLYDEKMTAAELMEQHSCSRATILQAVTKVIGARPAYSIVSLHLA